MENIKNQRMNVIKTCKYLYAIRVRRYKASQDKQKDNI